MGLKILVRQWALIIYKNLPRFIVAGCVVILTFLVFSQTKKCGVEPLLWLEHISGGVESLLSWL
jgi:hypothetical protein